MWQCRACNKINDLSNQAICQRCHLEKAETDQLLQIPRLYHGTTRENARSIIKNGYDLEHSGISAGRALGDYIYATSSLKFAADHGIGTVWTRCRYRAGFFTVLEFILNVEPTQIFVFNIDYFVLIQKQLSDNGDEQAPDCVYQATVDIYGKQLANKALKYAREIKQAENIDADPKLMIQADTLSMAAESMGFLATAHIGNENQPDFYTIYNSRTIHSYRSVLTDRACRESASNIDSLEMSSRLTIASRTIENLAPEDMSIPNYTPRSFTLRLKLELLRLIELLTSQLTAYLQEHNNRNPKCFQVRNTHGTSGRKRANLFQLQIHEVKTAVEHTIANDRVIVLPNCIRLLEIVSNLSNSTQEYRKFTGKINVNNHSLLTYIEYALNKFYNIYSQDIGSPILYNFMCSLFGRRTSSISLENFKSSENEDNRLLIRERLRLITIRQLKTNYRLN